MYPKVLPREQVLHLWPPFSEEVPHPPGAATGGRSEPWIQRTIWRLLLLHPQPFQGQDSLRGHHSQWASWVPLTAHTWTFLLPVVDNRSGNHEGYFWQIQSLMMPRKTHHKCHFVNFIWELKVFLVLSNIHMSKVNKGNKLESNPGVVTFSTNFSPYLWNFLPGKLYDWQSQEKANTPCLQSFATNLNTILLFINAKNMWID